MTLKGNHPLAHAAVVEHFGQRCFRVGAPCRADCGAFDDAHGRLVRRRVFASAEAVVLDVLSGWPGLRTVLAVESIRSLNSAPTKVEAEIRRFLLSCPDSLAVPREPEGFAAGPGDPLALGGGERAASGAGCHVLGRTARFDPRRRQPRARPHGRTQPGAVAQDRAQHRRPRHDIEGQRARPAEKGRLEQRLHAQASARVADKLHAGPAQNLMRSPWGAREGDAGQARRFVSEAMCDAGTGTLIAQHSYGTITGQESRSFRPALLPCRKPWFVAWLWHSASGRRSTPGGPQKGVSA